MDFKRNILTLFFVFIASTAVFAQEEFTKRWAVGGRVGTSLLHINQNTYLTKEFGLVPQIKFISKYYTPLHPFVLFFESGWNKYNNDNFKLNYWTNTFKPGVTIGNKSSVDFGIGVSSNILLVAKNEYWSELNQEVFQGTKKTFPFGLVISSGVTFFNRNNHLINLEIEYNQLLGTQFEQRYSGISPGIRTASYHFTKLSVSMGYMFVVPKYYMRKDIYVHPEAF